MRKHVVGISNSIIQLGYWGFYKKTFQETCGEWGKSLQTHAANRPPPFGSGAAIIGQDCNGSPEGSTLGFLAVPSSFGASRRHIFGRPKFFGVVFWLDLNFSALHFGWT